MTGVGPGGEPAMLASGRLASFRACYGKVTSSDEGVAIDSASASVLGVSAGDEVLHVAR